MNPDTPSAICFRHMDGVIKVPCIVRIDGEYRAADRRSSRARSSFSGISSGYLVRFSQDRIRESDRKIILPNDRQDIDTRLLRRTKDLNDVAFRIEVPMFPEAPAGQPPCRSPPACAASDRAARSHKYRAPEPVHPAQRSRNSSNAAASRRWSGSLCTRILITRPSRFARLRRTAFREDAISNNPGHHTILMHRRTLVLRRDIKISETVAGFIQADSRTRPDLPAARPPSNPPLEARRNDLSGSW